MDISKSLFLGGELIHADNPQLDYLSYKKLGLRCAFCGEIVQFKKGNIRIRHFAHLANIPSRKLEDCILRQTSYSTLKNSFSLTSEGKQQRLKIFQKYFLNIIASNDFKFYEKIELIQKRQKVEPDIEKITNFCITKIVVLEKEKIYFDAINKYFKKAENEKFPIFKEKIIQEALNYLCVLSSRTLLEQIIQYLIYQYEYDSEIKDNGYLSLGDTKRYQLKLSKLNEKNLYLHKNIKVICVGLLFILINIDWLEKINPAHLLIEKNKKAELLLKLKKTTKETKQTNDYKPNINMKNIFYILNIQTNISYEFELYSTESKHHLFELDSCCFFLEFKSDFQFQLITKTGYIKKQRYLGYLKNIYKALSKCIYVQWILFSDVCIDMNLTEKNITKKIKFFLENRVRDIGNKVIIQPPQLMSYQRFIETELTKKK